MYYAPHKLYLIVNDPTKVDSNGDPIEGTGGDTEKYLCDCFLHDVTTQIKNGYSGIGIDVSYYVNMDRRDDLLIKQEVVVKEGSVIRGRGEIKDIKTTSGMPYGGVRNYTTIYI